MKLTSLIRKEVAFAAVALATAAWATSAWTTGFVDYQGTIVMNVAITVKSDIPAGTQVICDATAKVASFEDQTETLTDISNRQATCTLTIPYSWVLPQAQTNPSALITYSLQTTDNETNGTSNRYSAGAIGNIPIPAGNTTITKDVSAVL